MEQPGPKQRSPWLYVLLGCLGFAALSCLGVVAVLGFGVKKANDMVQGVTDPTTRNANAKKMLGSIPPGYTVAMSMSFLGMVDTAILTDAIMPEDGGIELGDHVFTYLRVMANEQNKASKDFFVKGEGDLDHLRQNNINVDPRDIIKRGNFTVDGRRLYYVAARGHFGVTTKEAEKGLNATVMFDCPGEQLHLGVWSMRDPAPDKPASELDLTGTVVDEAEMSKFFKPMDPCGK